jgi:RNA polymerase sigma-70 factor (ECF subfamily)
MSVTLVIRDATMPDSGELAGALPQMDEEEFRSFYERTARPLWSYLARISGSPQQADDHLQEAYYRFYRAASRHESEAHRRNSLFRIATNLVRDAARRTRGFESVPLAEESLQLRSESRPEGEAMIRTDLARAMQQLEPVQRELLWLAYAQGTSHEEIAGILSLRTVSIRTMLLRARRKLAAILTGATSPESREERR